MTGKPNVPLIHSMLLFVLAAFTVSLALKLSEIGDSLEAAAKSQDIQGMLEQQDALRTGLETLEAKGYVTATQYESDRLELQQHMETLQPTIQRLGDQDLREDLNKLAGEVDRAKQALAELQKIAAARPAQQIQASRPNRKPAIAKPATPPFTVIGLESRGGESFLAVSPLQTHRLADIALLSNGDSHNGWQLSSIKAGRAHFVLPDGSRHAVNVR